VGLKGEKRKVQQVIWLDEKTYFVILSFKLQHNINSATNVFISKLLEKVFDVVDDATKRKILEETAKEL
jgi:hypothetical protein